jgi:hypothetical protein
MKKFVRDVVVTALMVAGVLCIYFTLSGKLKRGRLIA